MPHPDVTGVLLMAYGTPDSLDDVEPYYTHIRGGRTPSPELIDELRNRYALVGGRTPLSSISEATRSALETELNSTGAERFRVFLGMKHWKPWIKDAVHEMAAEGIRRAVGLVLAPHYSALSVAGYYQYVERAQQELDPTIDLQRIESWHLHPPYLAAVAGRVESALNHFPLDQPVTVVFTAHSLPQRIVADGDPYPRQLQETAETLAEMLDLRHWAFSYQSAGRTPEPWLGPDIVHTVNTLADDGVSNILVAPIGFVSDHLEIFYDIDHEAAQAAEARGVRLERTESLNASPDFVAGLAALVRSRIAAAVDS